MPLRTAALIEEGFEGWLAAFRAHTQRHAEHFARRAWRAAAADATGRLTLYEQHVQRTLARVREALGERLRDRETWAHARGAFAAARAGRPNVELAETFFNSLTRRVFQTVGVDPHIEFVGEALTTPQSMEAAPVYDRFEPARTSTALVERVLTGYDLRVPWENLQRDARRVAERLDEAVEAVGGRVGALEMLRPVFYRNKGAYLVGRVRSGDAILPLLLPLLHAPSGRGLRVDAALLSSNEASQVFSFTRSYFHADAEQPWALVHFLKSIIPTKRVAELYLSLGFTKHGKTELFRDLSAFLDGSTERFVRARGTPGMVMSVFTLPSYDIVFKVVKDRFDPVKTVTHDDVRRRYRFVMLHDRVGRLADVQEFEHLEFPRHRFEPALLDDLLTECAQTVHLENDRVVFAHLYTERRVTPLNLYLLEAPEAKARAAAIETGHAIRDLAAANIFPGDMLIKNFGVTRHGRVIFYDYDELDRLDAFTFREKPRPADPYAYTDGGAYVYAGPNDIFPEEIGQFMGFPARFAEAFRQAHPELLTPSFWNEMKARQRASEPVDLFPYRQEVRFPLD